MTNISFDRMYDTFYFECMGHTGYAVAGRDILCSAVSVLCYTLASYLEKASLEGRIVDYSSDFSSGSVSIRFSFSDGTNEEVILESLRAILGGFILLEESFPDFITADV